MTAVNDEAAAIGERMERGARSTVVYKYLRDMIVLSRIAPGSPLVEVEIATRLRLSRTPVRNALQRLHQQGFIVQTSGARLLKFAVAPLTREDAQALYDIVAELDGLSARYAAGIPDAARRELVKSMRALNNELRSAGSATESNHNQIYELDHVFHRQYAEAASTPRLLAMHDTVNPQVERYARVYAMMLAGEIHKSVREHDAILDALVAGDAGGAQEAARANWRNAGERLARAIVQIGERGRW